MSSFEDAKMLANSYEWAIIEECPSLNAIESSESTSPAL